MNNITAKDLMIGDWVSYKGKMPCKITAICKDRAVVDNDTTQDWGIDYDKLTPIPITAEIQTFPNEIAQFAVACADALIEELKKK